MREKLNISNCILILKQTTVTRDARAARLAARGDHTAARLISADREHNTTVDRVRNELTRLGISFVELVPHKFSAAEKRRLGDADLVISIGGDGTFLSASHYVRRGVMIGINSAPHDSIGHFCCADRRGFSRLMKDYLSGRMLPRELARLAISIDDRGLAELALNDVLIAHNSPAATTRYIIEIGGRSEEQRSSGIWISTAAGSTAAIRSAGGRKMPLTSRRMQYLVRELYLEEGRSYNLARGLLSPEEEILIASKMPEAKLYIDGSRTCYSLAFGTRARIKIAEQSLKTLVRE